MLYKNFLFLFMILSLCSCATNEIASTKSKKNYKYVYTKKTKAGDAKKYKISGAEAYNVNKLLDEAEKYKGAPYKYGGTSHNGIDCSGLVLVSYKKLNIDLPRKSEDMAKKGHSVSLSNVRKGDLIFFGNSNSKINHVGIIYNISLLGDIEFIHASSSNGVIISSLEEKYWKHKFKKIKRIL